MKTEIDRKKRIEKKKLLEEQVIVRRKQQMNSLERIEEENQKYEIKKK